MRLSVMLAALNTRCSVPTLLLMAELTVMLLAAVKVSVGLPS